MRDGTVFKTIFYNKDWILGVLTAIVIIFLSIFFFGEYFVYGIIFGISGGACVATFFLIDKERLSALQQTVIGWIFWLSILVIVIIFLITIVLYLSGAPGPSPECPTCP